MRAMTLVLLVLLAGCGDDGTGPNGNVLSAELAGTWVANSTCSPTCNFTLTSVANPSARIDLVAAAGLPVTLTLNRNGTASLVLFGESVAGTARTSGNMMILTSGGTADTIDYVVTSTTLDLTFRTPFDATGDPNFDPARAHAVLKKQ